MTTDMAAREIIDKLGTSRSMAMFTERDPAFDTARGYDVAALVHAARLARGERPVGRKIGFTNRTVWDQYGVRSPIWGFVYDTTLLRARGGRASVGLSGFAEPRIEPEIVLHFASAPPATRDEEAIISCIDWIAQGFEIVQSPFPRWKFQAADTVAVNGLHGALVVGDQVPTAAIPDCADRLRTFRVTLNRNGAAEAEGGGANVLDSPLLAFAHLTEMLLERPGFPPVAAGEMVTTGTLTAILPVGPGETWSTTLSGLDLPGFTITFQP